MLLIFFSLLSRMDETKLLGVDFKIKAHISSARICFFLIDADSPNVL